ncbi:MAG: hypothetical protein JWM43_3171 [Acidobacteriaceae bacterium]|nr:hypothetical protein [Acidobacteriaceae bacterium]
MKSWCRGDGKILISLKFMQKRLYRFRFGPHNEPAYMRIERNSSVSFFSRPILYVLVESTCFYPSIVPREFICGAEFVTMRSLYAKMYVLYVNEESTGHHQQRHRDSDHGSDRC